MGGRAAVAGTWSRLSALQQQQSERHIEFLFLTPLTRTCSLSREASGISLQSVASACSPNLHSPDDLGRRVAR